MTPLAPGLHYDVPLADYLGDCCAGPSISRSGLWTIDAKSPAHYYAESYLNPDREERDETAALRVGTAAHLLALEPDRFNAAYAFKPAGMNFSTKDGKAWRDSAVAAGKRVLDAGETKAVHGIAVALSRHPFAARALANTHPEATAVWRDPETGVWLKVRPDALPYKPMHRPFSVQIKTTEDASPAAFERSVWAYGYHLGAAMEIDILRALGWHSTPDALLIAVEKKPPYVVTLVRLRDDAIAWGRHQYRRALRRFADCLAAGKWPAYGDDVREIGLPEWAARQLERQMDAEAA